jgi:hypothetical protein
LLVHQIILGYVTPKMAKIPKRNLVLMIMR